MTMIDQRDLLDQEIKVEELRRPTEFASLERRRDAVLALDPLVRRALDAMTAGLPAATVDVTIYDGIYPANPAAGAHWTAASLLMGLLTHSVWSYNVTLLFDELDQPSRFAVHAAYDVVSEDVSEASLRQALQRARRRGPMQTLSSHFFPSLGI